MISQRIMNGIVLSLKKHRINLLLLLKRKLGSNAHDLHNYTPFYFVTTPIFYVNAAPHIGHLQSCVYADALSRTHQLLGYKTVFSTGTDEHGLKVQQASEAAGKEPVVFCEEIAEKFRNIFDGCNISYTNFVRTTSDNHIAAVHTFWKKLDENDYIYKGQYTGWYNVSEETFVPPSQVTEVTDAHGTRMVSSESGQPLQKMEEENYIFKLSKFKEELLYWLSTDVIKPSIYSDNVYRYLQEDLSDISVSRQRSRFQWGIPVPDDSSQTVYVWLDALVNYLTVSGYPDQQQAWPPDCHVIGKDILKFHAVYWPAFLIAAGMEPPRSIFCHSHWTVDHEKMSKSKGNVVDPWSLYDSYGCDGLRYFLLKAAVPHSDANYSDTKIVRLLNAELADTLGNLLSRCTALAVNKHQTFPKFSKSVFNSFCGFDGQKLMESVSNLPDIVVKHYLDGNFYKGLECIISDVRDANAFMQTHKPWELAKLEDNCSQQRLDTVLHVVLETLRIVGLLLQPVVPTMASDLLTKVGVGENDRSLGNVQCFLSHSGLPNSLEGTALGHKNIILFSRRKI